jgi:hypothetical protein
MRRFRFRISTLLILIIVLSVSFAALRESSDIWDSGVFTLALGALLVSILLAIHRTEMRQAFWLGFALFGAAHMAMSLVPPIESRLITTKALAFLESKVSDRPIVISGRVWDSWSSNRRTTENFIRIGHSLFALIIAFMGGRLSGYLYAKDRQPVQGPANPLESTSNGSGG